MYVVEVGSDGIPKIREINGMELIEQAKQANKISRDWALYFANLASFLGCPLDAQAVLERVKRVMQNRSQLEQENLKLVQENNYLRDNLRVVKDSLTELVG